MRATESAKTPAILEEFLIIIQPKRGWVGFDLGEIWGHRELLSFMVVFTVFFGKLAQIPSNRAHCAIFGY
jgi:hypothetical protein